MDPFDSPERLLAASLHATTALVWASLAHSFCRSHGTVRLELGSLWLFRIFCGLLAAHYGFNTVIDLTSFASWAPTDEAFHGLYILGCSLTQLTTIAVLPVLRHLVPLGSLGAERPSLLWLAINYGSGVVVAAAVWPRLLPSIGAQRDLVVHGYLLVMVGLILVDLLRLARSRRRPLLMANLGFAGFVAIALAVSAGVVAIIVTELYGGPQNLAWVVSHTFVGLIAAAPFALRILGEVVRRFLVTLVSLGCAFWIYFEVDAVNAEMANPKMARMLDIAAVLALVVVLGPGRVWLRGAVDRWILRQSLRWNERLHGFFQTLSPELGVGECCRRAAAEVAAGLNLESAAILLDSSTERVAYGELEIGAVATVWPRDAASLPDGVFDVLWLQDAALQEALYETAVTWVVPIRSPQRHWGHLFVAAGFWGTAGGDAKLESLDGFARQLALVLDVADLLDRSVAVERELAQAEKLAALGETAARIAHEIRNPVTAARSLAQLLARDPTSPLNAEHAGLVVRELDRVERQVKSLLQFARRESYQPEPLRLAELVGATLADLEASLEREQLEVELGVSSDVMVEADPERLRQVVVNLVDNAVDALADGPSPRRLGVSVIASNGDAVLTVEDSGPGVAEELLPRIFDPFVSRKAKGTGLGLAIAKRIVETHGGSIEAEPALPTGMAFRVRLPAVEAPRQSAGSPDPVRQAL